MTQGLRYCILVILAAALLLTVTGYKNQNTQAIWYTSVVLDAESAAILREYAEANIPWPKDDFYYSCEHMTTCHKNSNRPDLMEWNLAHEGEIVYMNATQVGHSDKAFAVKLECDVPVASGVPHVTLAVNKTNGGVAFDSASIQEWTPLESSIPLKGKIVIHYETSTSEDR